MSEIPPSADYTPEQIAAIEAAGFDPATGSFVGNAGLSLNPATGQITGVATTSGPNIGALAANPMTWAVGAGLLLAIVLTASGD